MRRVEESPQMPMLDELKERGANAMAETREILRDMKTLAIEVRREVYVSLRLGGRMR